MYNIKSHLIHVQNINTRYSCTPKRDMAQTFKNDIAVQAVSKSHYHMEQNNT